jgi:phenylalanyl-tRNA synthetase alpha chain
MGQTSTIKIMPATKLLYLTNSFLKETNAKIVKVESGGEVTGVVLNQTLFYPQGGGQPFDTGNITGNTGSLKVAEVIFKGKQVIHLGKLTGELASRETVKLSLDWDNRYAHMQAHTAGHLLDEAVKDILPEHHGVTGMHGIGKHFYIKFSGFIDAVHRNNIQKQISLIIENNEPVTGRLVTNADIEKESIYLPFKLPENKPLRVIQIGDRQPVPDGGTQLQSTAECWPITLTDFTYEEGYTLIHYRVETPKQEVRIKKQDSIESETTISDFRTALDKLKIQFTHDNPSKDTRIKYLGKNGLINQIAKEIPHLAESDRAAAGQLLNKLKTEIEMKFSLTPNPQIPNPEFFDPTYPAEIPPIGHLHLITEAIEEIESIFARLGFVRRRYPEIETDWYYAEGLNIPKNHPARDDQETFYLSENVVLTAHTSNGQLREMELMKKPPIKMINIGKTYRRQASNTHSPMFHQFEGLLIDKDINITHLFGVSNYFAKEYFGPDREIRLRPHHFQFTEPSFEVDINCYLCKGRGVINGHKCKVCKSGWLELGGAGMVHPIVLKNGGINPDEFTGFAFGWGVERVIMMKHPVTDNLRDLYTQDLRFLNQS